MFGGVDTVGDQIIEVSKDNADAIHIRSTDYLLEYSEQPEKVILVAVSGVADEGYRIAEVGRSIGLSSEDEVLGFVLCGTFRFTEFDDYMYCDLEDDILGDGDVFSRADFPVFAFHTMGVKKEYANKGVLDELTKAAVDTGYSHYPYVAGVWEGNEEAHSQLSIFGESFVEVDEFYPNWPCPDCCGDCDCSCLFYCSSEEEA